ncbi:hypothetical protein AFCA_010115 [Aspergillus flavus]|nr:hypothetical protein AFCA_010115 [Aspergillus flavus]
MGQTSLLPRPQCSSPLRESAILASDWPEPTTIALSGPSYAIFGHHQTRDAKPQDSTPCESSQLHDVSGNAE